MATLSIVKGKLIAVAKWVGIVLGIIIGVFLLIKFVFFVKEIIHPTPPIPPTVAFGKLPAIAFPDGIKKNYVFSVDTLTGDLPSMPDRSKVYKMDKAQPDILAVERAKTNAKSIGFDQPAEKLSDTIYRWTSIGPPAKSLVMNIHLLEFTLISSFLTDETILSANNLPTKDDATGTAKSFLSAISLYPDDIDENKTRADILRVDGGVITPATSVSKTQLVSVYFFQKDRDKMPIVYPLGAISTINLTVAGGYNQPQVIDARYFYQKISNQSATYPIITTPEALDLLKKGKAYVASADGQDLNILIKKVYLGFYSGSRRQDYLMPVVVFEGNNNFVAYVSAVKDEWIGN